MKKTSIVFQYSLVLVVLLLAGCVKHKDLLNFKEGTTWKDLQSTPVVLPKYRLQPDDLIELKVSAFDQSAAAPFNLTYSSRNNMDNVSSGNSQGTQYLLDHKGCIALPLINKICLSELTIPEARDSIASQIRRFITDPIVDVRLASFKVTVLGEVNRTGVFEFKNEHVTVLEALGMAGDLTTYGRRDSVLITREVNGIQSYGWVNLKSRDLFKSPYYYLMPSDVIYVEPMKSKTGAIADESNKLAPWVLAGVTFINILITLIR